MILIPALTTLLLLACHHALVRRRPGAWSNGMVLALAVAAGVATALVSLALLPAVGPAIAVLVVVAMGLGALALPVLLVLNGVTMARREGLSPSNMLSGLVGLALMALPVWMVLAIGTAIDPAIVVGASATMALAWLSFAFLGYLASVAVIWRRRMEPGDHDIIVLGSGLIGDRVPPLLASRIDRAIDQWHLDVSSGHTSMLIPSGGRGSDELRTEGDAMADYMVARGIPREAIVVEDRATNTDENLAFSTALVPAGGTRSPVVVTSSYHAVRAADLCRRQGIAPATVIGSDTAGYFLPSALLREFIALLVGHPWLNGAVLAVLVAIPPLLWWAS